MSSILHVLRAVMESDTSEFGKNIKAAAEGTQKLGKAWDDTAKLVGRATEKVDKAAQKAAREAERLAQRAAKAQEKAAREMARAQEKAAREATRAQEKAAREMARLARETARIQERAAREAARAQERAAREAAKAAREAARAAEKAARDAAKAAHDMGRAWLSAAHAMDRAATRVVAVVGTAATGIAGFVGKIGLEFNAMQERSTIAFTTLLESAQKAREFMGQLRDFAKKTPFELPGLIQAAQKMLAMGFAANEILPTLTAVGDAAAGLGGSQETLDRITRALGQMKAKGKVQAEEMLQLAEAGVPAWQFLADFLQTDIPTAMAMVTDGAVTASQGIEAIVGGMQRKFGGLMVEQSTTFTGLISNLKDTLNQAAGQVMEPAFVRIREAMANMMEAIGGPEFEAAVGRIGQKIAGLVDDVSNAFKNIRAEDVIRRLESVISGSISTVRQLGQAFLQIAPSLAQVSSEFSKVLGAVLQFLTQNPILLKALVTLKVAGFFGLTDAAAKLGIALVSTVKAVTGFGTATAAAGVAAKGALPALSAILGPAGVFVIGAAAIWGAVKALEAYNKASEKRIQFEKDLRDKEQKNQRDIEEETQALEGAVSQFRKDDSLSRITGEIRRLQEERKQIERDLAETAAGKQEERNRVDPGRGATVSSPRFKELTSQEKQQQAQLAGNEAQIRATADQFAQELREQLARALGETGLPKEAAAGFQERMNEIIDSLGKVPLDRLAKEAVRLVSDVREEAKKMAAEEEKILGPMRKQTEQLMQAAKIRRELESQSLKKRQENVGPEFERIAGLMTQPNQTEQSVQAIAESIEGITQEFIDKLVNDFRTMRNAGKLTKENIELSVLNVLEGVKKAEEQSKLTKEKTEREREQARTAMIDFQSDVATNPDASDALKMRAQEGALAAEEEFLAGNITLDIFRQKLAVLREELQNGIQAAAQKAAAEKKIQDTAQAELAKFNARLELFAKFLPTARLAKTRELAQKLAEAFKKGEITIEQLRARLGALGKSALDTAKKINESIENMLKRAFAVRRRQRSRNGIGTGFATSFQGDDGPGFQNQVPDPSAGWVQFVGFMNSTAGMIASVQNQIALLQQNLQVLDRARDRIQVERQIESLMRTLNQLLTPAPSLVTGVNSLSGIFFDPGLTGASGGPGGPGKAPMTFNFHSLTRPTPEDARILVDTFEEELARRGWR